MKNLLAYMFGTAAIPMRCKMHTDLADWFRGFALACRDAAR